MIHRTEDTNDNKEQNVVNECECEFDCVCVWLCHQLCGGQQSTFSKHNKHMYKQIDRMKWNEVKQKSIKNNKRKWNKKTYMPLKRQQQCNDHRMKLMCAVRINCFESCALLVYSVRFKWNEMELRALNKHFSVTCKLATRALDDAQFYRATGAHIDVVYFFHTLFFLLTAFR